MKTIFLTSFHALISRNILMSGLFTRLTKNHRVVLLVPAHKVEYFKEHFSGDNVIIEGISTELGKHDLLWRRIMLACTPTQDLFIKKRAEFFKDKKLFSYLASVIPAMLVGRMKFVIQLLRTLDYRTANTTRFSELYVRYKPSLIVSTDVQNENDSGLLREAHKRNIRTIGMVRSWDNLTSKGIIRFVPERLIVHNEIIKAEAIRYSFVSPEIISVIGIPHYDRYFEAREALRDAHTREEKRSKFFSEWHFDAKKKLILFAPFGDRYIRDNQTDIHILETLSGLDANILVRLPPTDTVNFKGFKTQGALVRFYESGKESGKGGKKVNEISDADEKSLVKSLLYADVVVTGQSTIAVDAAAFDKPVVIAAFDHEPRLYWDSVTRYFDYEYYKKFKERSGLKLARSAKELLALVTQYSKDPTLYKPVRERIVRDQLFSFDGNATERLARIIEESIS